MADSPSQPPSRPHDEISQPPIPQPPIPPEAPTFEPPPAPMPAAPFPQPSGYEPPMAPPAAPHPPAGYEPPPPAATYPPPSGHQPPAPLAASYPPPAAAYPPPQQHYAPGQPYATPGQPYAAPGQPPPGWGAPPQKKSHRTLWITLAAIFGVLALGVGSCTVWFVGTVKAPVDESNRFLAAIDARDYATAAAMTDPSCNQGMTAAALDEIFAGADINYNLSSSSITNSSATVSGSFSAQGLSSRFIELSLWKQGDWRVCGFRIT